MNYGVTSAHVDGEDRCVLSNSTHVKYLKTHPFYQNEHVLYGNTSRNPCGAGATSSIDVH